MPILSELNPTGNEANLTTEDVSSDELFMSPEEQTVFDQYRAQRGPVDSGFTGALPVNAYYPDAGHNIAVGHYGGREIGNTTIFAPGGGLVPLGMMDARDRAIQMAAAGKAKEVDDFRKQFKAPTSKLTNINENLTDEYINHIQGSWQKALKKTGGDGNAAKFMLQNDPDFWKKEKSYQDMAKMGDDIAAKTAQDELDIRSGKFTPTPAYKSLQNRLYKAINPADPEFKNLGNIYRTMQIERDFSDAFTDVTKDMVAEQLGKSGADLNDPEFIKEWERTVKSWSPEQKEGVAKTLQESFFPDSDYWTPEKIKQNVDYRLRGSQTDSKTNVTQKREDNTDKYTVKDISEEQSAINGNVIQTGGTLREAKYPTSDGLTFKTPVNIVLPVGTKAVDLQAGGVRNRDIGNMKAEIGGIFNASTYKALGEKDAEFDGMMLDEKNAKERKGAMVTPMVSVKYTKKNEEGDDEVVSTFVPLASIKNAVMNKGNKEAIEEIERRAAEKNSKKQPEAAPAAEKKVDVSALRKKYNY